MRNFMEAVTIQDEEILVSLMQGLIDIGKTSTVFLVKYLDQLGNMTAHFINSGYESVAKMAIEFWTTVCESEYARMVSQGTSESILKDYNNTLLQIIFLGLSKMNEEDEQDVEDHDETIWTVSLASGCALENLARVMCDSVLDPVFSFSSSRFRSEKWQERMVAYLALGAIIEGPSQQNFAQLLNGIYLQIVRSIQDDVPKVQRAIAYVLYRISSKIPQIAFSSQENVDVLISTLLTFSESQN